LKQHHVILDRLGESDLIEGGLFMFKFKDIIKMDYETYKRMITALNANQSAFVIQINKEENLLELKVGEQVQERFAFTVEPWMEPAE
jgi:hypothetical protein